MKNFLSICIINIERKIYKLKGKIRNMEEIFQIETVK